MYVMFDTVVHSCWWSEGPRWGLDKGLDRGLDRGLTCVMMDEASLATTCRSMRSLLSSPSPKPAPGPSSSPARPADDARYLLPAAREEVTGGGGGSGAGERDGCCVTFQAGARGATVLGTEG